MRSACGSLRRATALAQTSARLNGQMELAIETAMPTFALTRMEGKVAGKRVGSVMVLS